MQVGRGQQARAKAACRPKAKAKAKAKSKGGKAKAKAKAKSKATRKAGPKAKAKSRATRKAVPKSQASKGSKNQRKAKSKEEDHDDATDHYSEDEGRPALPKKRVNQNKASKDPSAELKTPTPKRRRRTSASGSKPKKTFARRVEPKTDPSKTYWNAIKESFEAEVQGKVKHPSSLEDRFEHWSYYSFNRFQSRKYFDVCNPFIIPTLALLILHVGPLLEVLQWQV